MSFGLFRYFNVFASYRDNKFEKQHILKKINIYMCVCLYVYMCVTRHNFFVDIRF